MSQTKQTSFKNQQHLIVQPTETKSKARSIKKQSQLHEDDPHQQNDRKSQIGKSKNGSVKPSEKSMSKHEWNAAYEGSQFEVNRESKNKKNIQDSLKKKSQRPISELEWDAVYHNQIFDVGQLKKNQSQVSEKKMKSINSSRKNQMNWQTAYIDDKFYLSDPVSLARLKQLEDQIEAERKKLANIESNQKFDHSFLSQQQFDDEDNKIDTLTQVNQSRLLKRKQNAEADLLKEQQKYRMKLQQMKKKKAILKKQIGCGTNQKNLQVDSEEIKKEQEEIKVQKKSMEKLNIVAEKGNKKSEKQTGDMEKLSPSVKRQLSKKSQPQLESPEKKSAKKSQVIEKSMKATSEKKQNSKIEKSQKSPIVEAMKATSEKKQNSKIEKSQKSPIVETMNVNKQQELEKSRTKSHKSSSKQKSKQIQISLPELPETAKSHKISGLKSQIGKSQKEGQAKKSQAQSQIKSVKDKQRQSSVRTKNKEQSQKDPSIHINIIQQNKKVDPSIKRHHQQVNLQVNNKEIEKDVKKNKTDQQIELTPSNKSKAVQIQQKQPSVRSKAKSKKQQLLDQIEENKLLSQKKSEKVEKQMTNMESKELTPKEKSIKQVERSQKQKSVASVKPSENIPKQKSDINVPISKANQNSFKKTDKSVQWQQIEPSVRNEERSVSGSYQEHQIQSRIKDGRSERSRVSGSEYKSQSNYRSNNKYQTEQQKSVTPYEHEQESIKERSQDREAQNSQEQEQSYKYNVIQKASHNSSAIGGEKSVSEIKSNQNQNHIKVNKHSQNDRKSEVSKKLSEISKVQKQSGKIKRRVAQDQAQNVQQTQQQSFEQILNEGAQSQAFQKYANQKNPNQISMSESQLTSQKRRPSFKIHSRDNSIKSKHSNSKYNSKQKTNKLSESEHSVHQKGIVNDSESLKSQLQLKRLNLQISQLQQKLKKVEEKQQQIFKFENNQSKAYNQNQNLEASNNGSQSASPLGKMNLTSRLKLQQKLTLEASTVQFNTFQQKLKRTAEQNEKLEKLKLQEEIGRLKKIIRDMQMQKIKSIQYDPNETSSKFQIRRQSIIDGQSNNNSRVSEKDKWRDSLNSQMIQTKRNQWNTQTVNKDTKEDVGKIIRNSPHKNQVVQAPPSPRRYNKVNASRSKQLSEFAKDQIEDEKQQLPLPLRRKAQSVHGVQGVNKNKDLTKQQLMNKFEENEKNFHQFLQSSRLIGHDYQSYVEPVNSSLPQVNEKKQEFQSRPQPQILASSVQQPSDKKIVSRNFSQIIQKLKYENPEDQISKPSDIAIGNINMPDIPEPPNISMSQDDLLELAKKTYKIFGINVDEDQNQLCMKKYKNCVVFNFGNNQQQTILWHYSGKFYFGGWKNTSDPGQGQKIGEGLQYIPGKHIYKGQFLGGKKNGNGIIKMNNGNIYDGQWVDGTKNGRGVYYESSTGTFYSGQWKQGKRDGYGILKFSNQQFYQGTFSKSIKHGYGIQKFINGDFYKGQYQKGKFHGKGKYCWSNGSSYEGDFVEGSRQGQGNWKSSRKGGDLYTGGYQSDKKSGYGRYLWANGCVYQGYFKNDLKNGKGRLVYQDGKQIKGSWQDGNLVSADQEARKIQQHQEQPLRRSIRATSLKNSSNPLSNSFRKPVHF